MGLPMTAKKLHKITNQDLIDDEVEAIDGYQDAIEESDNPEAIEVYEHIKGEEEEHIAELEGLDKMKAEDITSEQAWEDFKAGYSDFEERHIGKDRDGDKASLSEKIDLMNAKLEELNTDVSRLTDSVPQALGVIEEGKTVEEEAEQNEMEGEDDLFGADEDFDALLGDESEGKEPAVDENGNPIEESVEEVTDEDGNPVKEATDEEGKPVDGNDVTEGEEAVDDDVAVDDEEITDDSKEDTPEADGESDGDSGDVEDEDYIPIEDLDDEESEDEDEEEVLEKMVKVLAKLDKRVTHLERENMGLKKMLSQRQVQTEATPVAKSRPRPNTNLRMVKGSYNRPPVSTQYVANQRDIGIGKKTENAEETPVFHQALNEVFENCNRIANQTN